MDEQGIGAVGMIIYFAVIILLIASLWKVFSKAGKPGWAAIIPIYNIIVLLEIVGKPIWWIILFFIPLVNIVVGIIVVHQLSLSFGQGVGFTIGLILLGFIFYPILGFGDSEYQGPGGGGLATEPVGGAASSASAPAATVAEPPTPTTPEPESDESEGSGESEGSDESEGSGEAPQGDEPEEKVP